MSNQYKELQKLIHPQTIEERVNTWEQMTRGKHRYYSVGQAVIIIRELESSLELAVNALERIEGFWEVNTTVKTYARDALKAIKGG